MTVVRFMVGDLSTQYPSDPGCALQNKHEVAVAADDIREVTPVRDGQGASLPLILVSTRRREYYCDVPYDAFVSGWVAALERSS